MYTVANWSVKKLMQNGRTRKKDTFELIKMDVEKGQYIITGPMLSSVKITPREKFGCDYRESPITIGF